LALALAAIHCAVPLRRDVCAEYGDASTDEAAEDDDIFC
jgi:hypothetical protein